MRQREGTFEDKYNAVLLQVQSNSRYGRIPTKARTYMAAAEMGKMLGLKKTDLYWLLHKNYFEWEEIAGKI